MSDVKCLLGSYWQTFNEESACKLISASRGLCQMKVIHLTFYNMHMHTCICKVGANISQASWFAN